MVVRRRYEQIIAHTLLLLGMVLVISPMIYLISYSLRPNSAIYQYPPTLLPALSEITIANYAHVLIEKADIYRYFLNSFIVSTISISLTALVSSLLAYGIARFRFHGKNLLFSLIMATMIIPGLALILPQFELAVFFGFINSLLGLILIYTAWSLPFSTFLIKGFVEGIPRDFDNAVLIDGGNYFTIYRHIIIPLASPAIASVSIFNFLFVWEEYPWALTVINNQRLRTLPIYIAGFFGRHNYTQYGYIFAVSVISLVPVILLFICLQRFFIQGLSAGAIKG